MGVHVLSVHPLAPPSRARCARLLPARREGMRLHRRDPVVLGTPAAPAARGTCGSSIARTLRTAWWPRFAVAGVVLTVIGATLLSGAAQALVALGGAVVFVFAVTQLVI